MKRIFALVNPVKGEVRYVGETDFGPEEKLRSVINSALQGEGTWRGLWIRTLCNQGMSPKIVILEEDPPPGRLRFWRIHFKNTLLESRMKAGPKHVKSGDKEADDGDSV